jgi:hypothetical protein
MIRFTATILKFGEQGEKTGWSYIHIPAHLAQELKPDTKKSFRVKGAIDAYKFEAASLLPMGGGDFILPINAAMRKGTGKKEGAMVKVSMEEDKKPIEVPKEFAECLEEDEAAKAYFNSIPKSHQNYWIKWIASVKTEEARVSRIVRAVNALAQGHGFAEMLRAEKAARF